MKKTKKKATGLKALVAGVLIGTLSMTAIPATLASAGTLGGKYYSDYTSYSEALEEAGKINLEVAEEGNVLLKNDGTLPLKGRERISVFGVGSSVLVGGASNTNSVANPPDASERGAIYDSLVSAGFSVNGVLADWYSNNTTGASQIGNEPSGNDFSAAVRSTFNMYNDVAVVVLSRNAGEGSDAKMAINEVEDNRYGSEEQGWEHDALYKADEYKNTIAERSSVYNEDGTEYKHYLQLTDSEEALIEYVEDNFKKVVVVLNTANAMEVYNLREDDKVNSILLMGRPGETGHYAVGEILAGTVNPSGKLVDEWNTDFTADPTWNNYSYGDQAGSQNMYYYGTYGTSVKAYDQAGESRMGSDITYGTHNQSGYYGVDYEEDIYLGYNYWETKYYEIYNALYTNGTIIIQGNKKTKQLTATQGNAESCAKVANEWYDENVAFTFGHGLSYTKFSFNIDQSGIYALGGKNNSVVTEGTLEQIMITANLASEEGSVAKVKTLCVPVKVTNTGSVAGKEVVEIYVTAPYNSETKLEKSFVALSGYAKTDTLRPGESETVIVKVNVQDFASFDYLDANEDEITGYTLEKGEYIVRAMNTAHFDVATNLSDKNDAYDQFTFTLSDDVNQQLDDFSDKRTSALFSEEYGAEGVTAATDTEHNLVYQSIRTSDLAADGKSHEILLTRGTILSYFPEAPTEGDLTLKTVVIDNWDYWNNFSVTDLEGDDWYKASVDEDWTQGTGVADTNGQYDILITDMLGVKLYNEDGTMTDAWNTFMNQLTIDELKTIVERQRSMWTSTEVKTIGKRSSTQADSYNDVRTAGGTFLWTDSPTLSATWNTELANKVGRARGNIEVLQGWSAWGGKEMDTHRSPFSGRNAEYLSQDGLQGGYIAAAFTSGMESMGVTCYIKHFALNDMETCRDGMCNNVWASEQAVRQNNFKVFQMAMQEGGASGSMTGFARFCGIPMNANNAVLDQMVCQQWGWEGFYITDGYSGVSKCTTMESMLRGYCIPLPLGSSVPNVQGKWDATLRNGKGGVTINGVQNDTQYYYLRMTAARILYADAKSNDVTNGFVTSYIDLDGVDTLQVAQGSELDASLAVFDSKGTKADMTDSSAVYTLTRGELPAGITLSSNGSISGTPTEAGSFEFTVDCIIDNWVDSEIVSGLQKTYTLTVESAFAIDDETDALDSAKVGEEFYSAIVSDTYMVGETYKKVEYKLLSGDLTSYGLDLDADGHITGTPTKNGTIDFTVQITASKASSTSGGGFPGGGFPGGGFPGGGFPGGGFPGGGGNSGETFTYTGTITITGGAEVEVKYLTETEIKALIEESLSDVLTEEQIEDMINASKGLTEAEVKALIDSAVEESSSGCNGTIATELPALIAVLSMAIVVAFVSARKRKENLDK